MAAKRSRASLHIRAERVAAFTKRHSDRVGSDRDAVLGPSRLHPSFRQELTHHGAPAATEQLRVRGGSWSYVPGWLLLRASHGFSNPRVRVRELTSRRCYSAPVRRRRDA